VEDIFRTSNAMLPLFTSLLQDQPQSQFNAANL